MCDKFSDSKSLLHKPIETRHIQMLLLVSFRFSISIPVYKWAYQTLTLLFQTEEWSQTEMTYHSSIIYIYIYSFSNSFPFSYCRMLSRVPCGYLFYIQQCAHVRLLEAVSQGTRKRFHLQHGPVLIWKPFSDWNLPPDVQLIDWSKALIPLGKALHSFQRAQKGQQLLC